MGRLAITLRVFLAGSLLLTPLFPVRSEELAHPDLLQIREEVRDLKANLVSIRNRAASTERDLDATDVELAIFERELEMAERLKSDVEQQRKTAEDQITVTRTEIELQRKFLSARLATLYRLGNMSYLRLLLSIQDEKNPFEAIAMLSFLVSRDAREIRRFRDMQDQLSSELAGLQVREAKLAELSAFSDAKRNEIARKKRDQERMLASLRSDTVRSERRLAQLQEKEQRLERLLGLLYEQKGSETPLSARITEFKGALQWPLKGQVIEGFGRQRSAKFATYTVNNGIKIGAPAGTAVAAVFEGKVLYAQWLKGYGNILVVDHGERVYSLYGNTRGSLVPVGNKVVPGQVITSVAEGEDGVGYLYFEIRENNKPADPLQWLR